MNKPKIIIVDNNLTFRQSLTFILTIENIAEVIGVASNGKEFMNVLSGKKPDLVLMGFSQHALDGIETTKNALRVMPDLKIIVFSMFGHDGYYSKMIDLGVSGFLQKSCHFDEFKEVFNLVMNGENNFSLN